MKVKLLIVLIALLGIITNLNITRKKFQRKKFSSLIIRLLTGGLIAGSEEYSDNSKTKMAQNYAKVLDDEEGIKRLFSDNLFKICQSSLESNALNSELVFKFRLKMYKLRKHFPYSPPEDGLKGELKEIEKNLKSAKNIKSMEKANKIVVENFISEFVFKFSKLEAEIKQIAYRETKIKEELCFGELEEKLFLKGNKDTFDKMHEVILELEETENFIELFRFPEERREEWLAKALKYNPEKAEEIINVTDSNPKTKRYLKGIIKILKTFVPFGELFVETGDNILTIISDIWEGKSALDIFKRLVGIVGDFTFGKVIDSVGKIISKGLFALFSPITSVIQSIKTIIQSRSSLRANEIETSLEEIRREVAGMNEIHIKSIQSIHSSDNSIWIYRMVRELTKLDSKIQMRTISPYHDEELKALCRENLYVCGKELTFDYIRNNFLKEKVCPGDIFLAQSKDFQILRDSKFTLVKKNFTEDYDLYLNHFFSLSDTLILQTYVSETTGEDRMKENVINDIESFSYNGKGECKELGSQISVRKLKYQDKTVHLVVINKEFAYKCNVIQYSTCRNMTYFFKNINLEGKLKRFNSLAVEPQNKLVKPLKRTNSNRDHFEVSSDVSDLGTIDSEESPKSHDPLKITRYKEYFPEVEFSHPEAKKAKGITRFNDLFSVPDDEEDFSKPKFSHPEAKKVGDSAASDDPFSIPEDGEDFSKPKFSLKLPKIKVNQKNFKTLTKTNKRPTTNNFEIIPKGSKQPDSHKNKFYMPKNKKSYLEPNQTAREKTFEIEQKLSSSKDARERRMKHLVNLRNKEEKLTKQDLDYNNPERVTNIQQLLMKKVCETAKKPFNAFSEKEKTEMEAIIAHQLPKITGFYKNEKEIYVLQGTIEDFLEIQEIPSVEIKMNFLDCILILNNLVPVEFEEILFELLGNEGKTELRLFLKYDKNPTDANILNYYSSGSKYCVHHKFIRNRRRTTGYTTYDEILRHNQIENVAEIEEKNPETVNYFSDLQSRVSGYGRIFELAKNDEDVYEYTVTRFFNEDSFDLNETDKQINLKNMHADYDSCHFTYQFVFLRIEDGENKGYSFKFMDETDKLGLPLLKIKKAKEGELAFRHKFYILVYSDSDDISDENVKKRNGLYSTISKKLAHFGYYAVPNQGKENKVSVNHTRFWIDFNQGNLRIEVFVKPFKESRHEENKSICERIASI